MKEPVILVRNFDGLANRMFRYMFAKFLSMKTGGLKVIGFNMPEWGLVSPEQDIPLGSSLKIGPRHKIDVQDLVKQIQSGNFDWIDVDCYAMRLEYFAKEKEHFANTFRSSLGEEIQGDEILIHIRTGDIVNGQHPDYTPIPIAYYHRIIFETGMKPVFIGQLTGNWYVDALHRQFPHARYIEGDIVSDFQTIRRSKTVMIAVSSFSWLAAFLSTEATQIHMPIAGIFNPNQRPDIDLMPTSDSRYHFHWFQAEKYTASEKQIAILSSPPAWARALPRPESEFPLRASEKGQIDEYGARRVFRLFAWARFVGKYLFDSLLAASSR